MRWLLLLLLVLLSSISSSSQAAVSSLGVYISPTGSDANDGSKAHPFQSLQRVQTEIRLLLLTHAAAPLPINVFFRGGRYELTETLEFTTQDTSSSSSTVTYQAYCDPAVETSLISVEPYPYSTHLPTPPRLLWNGNGNKTQWQGPMDPFVEMEINRTTNTLLLPPGALLAQPAIPVMDIGDVCVDKAQGGHTCYSGAIATCVSGCMTACQRHVARKMYSQELYQKFSHLFGKQLQNEEDCVEACAQSCRGCEQVTLSGAKKILPGQLTNWAVYKIGTAGRKIFQADLTAFLPSGPIDPGNPGIFSTLYVDDVLLPRAGYPDCTVTVPEQSSSLTEFDCGYVTPLLKKSPNTISFDASTFSQRVAQWTNVASAEVDVMVNKTESLANLRYKIKEMDLATSEIALGAGGAQLTVDQFNRGLDVTTATEFRVENILQELDVPGEWFFDPASKLLYLMPLDATMTLARLSSSVTLEIPLLRQLVRVSGSRENVYTSASHASHSLVATDSTQFASNLIFRQLTFSGTQLLTSDLYEATGSCPASSWPMARIGAVFMETVANITIEHCSFSKIQGNAIVVSGESDAVALHHNNISFVGSLGVAILARVASHHNSFGSKVLAHTLFSRFANISFNNIHHFGKRVAHSSAIMVVGATQTTVQDNLIYAFPPKTGRAYWIADADGANADAPALLMRGLDTLLSVPQTLAQNLSTDYQLTIAVATPGFDVPVVVKLIGAPECPSGSGRIGSLYGEQLPFTYTQCSGCCSLHANAAKIRVAGSGISWAAATSREVVLRPGESLELQAPSSAFFNSITEVYLGFHVVTPNQIVELPTVRAKWQILTRKCQYADHTYLATCYGPCSNAAATGCGNSNMAIQQSTALQCDADYEADPDSLSCTGPFDAMADCDGSGVLGSHLYYNCSRSCFTTSCT